LFWWLVGFYILFSQVDCVSVAVDDLELLLAGRRGGRNAGAGTFVPEIRSSMLSFWRARFDEYVRGAEWLVSCG
jgi:hypothetical protein